MMVNSSRNPARVFLGKCFVPDARMNEWSVVPILLSERDDDLDLEFSSHRRIHPSRPRPSNSQGGKQNPSRETQKKQARQIADNAAATGYGDAMQARGGKDVWH